jgi:hypothetical protein
MTTDQTSTPRIERTPDGLVGRRARSSDMLRFYKLTP